MKFTNLLFLFALTLISCNNAPDFDKANTFNEQSQEAIDNNDYDTANNLAQKSLDIYKAASDSLGMSNSYYLMARASALAGDFNKAMTYGETASRLIKNLNEFALEYKINNTLSWAYFMLGKDYYETLDHEKRQLYVVEQLDDDASKALVHNNFGYNATVAGSMPLEKAIVYTKFANDYYAKKESSEGRWYTLMNLAWQYRLLNDLETSEAYARLSVAQAKKDEDRHAIVEANTCLGETLILQNRLEEARPYYQNTVSLANEKDDRDKHVFNVYYSKYLWEIGKTKEAIDLCEKAVAFLETSEVFYEMLGRAFLAHYYLTSGNTEGVEVQLNAFKNPRANYFSQEARMLASLTEAKMISKSDKAMALEIIDTQLNDVAVSKAELLKLQLEDLKTQLQ